MDSQQQQQPQPPPRISLEEIAVWIDDRKKAILAGIALIGLAGLAWVIVDSNAQGKEHRAAAALFELQMSSGDSTNVLPSSAYEGLLPATEGTGIAQHVSLREAVSLFAAENYGEAQASFENFLSTYPDSPLAPEASLGTATSLEAQGKTDEALARYQELTTRFPQSSLVDRARLSQARIYEKKGDQQQAFRIFQDLASRGMTDSMGQFRQPSPLQIEANLAVRRLVQENPSLLQTNAPSAAPTVPPVGPSVSLPAAPAGS